jgi:hypothetical protein
MKFALAILLVASMSAVAAELPKFAEPTPKKMEQVGPSDKTKSGEANPRPWCGKQPSKTIPKQPLEKPATAPVTK